MTEGEEPAPQPDARLPKGDAAKVARLRAAIAAGEYTVDPETIADRLVERGFPGDVNPS